MQTLIVFLIIGAAVCYLARRFYKMFKQGPDACGCGCSGCSEKEGCPGLDELHQEALFERQNSVDEMKREKPSGRGLFF
jgi:hypothetical protein